MKKSKEKGFFEAVLSCVTTGISVGVPVAVFCMVVMGTFNDTLQQVIVWIIASALIGLLSAVFFAEKINLIVSTIVHCVGCFVVAVAASILCGYSDNLGEVVLMILPIFLIIYVVLYAVVMIYLKIQAKRIDKVLNK